MLVRYSVTATLASRDFLEEYLNWLNHGHVQAVVEGGAESAEVIVLEDDSVKVETSYIFPSRESLQKYFDGPAIALREDGKVRFMDTGKIKFERRIGEIVFECAKNK